MTEDAKLALDAKLSKEEKLALGKVLLVAAFKAFLVGLLIGVLGASLAMAQSIDDHATGHDIYKDWKRPGGGMSCCSGKDCGPWSAEDVSPVQNGFWVHSLEKFVPMKHVLSSPDGQYHVCCRRSAPDLPCEKNEAGETIIYCLAAPMGY